ncbi:hypothetical protein MCW82_07030 [Azospirillum doebereinerae]|uniref:hypothetical protein n=1 Tax=Azospirillum doebereinerae TaxID=92933 RepID=UPI001EE5EE58|nr:hypothetical protein [Azospirillum doebereinerae]MCG5239520.1 hypothetical protein [Azospirillum doebereinerae]
MTTGLLVDASAFPAVELTSNCDWTPYLDAIKTMPFVSGARSSRVGTVDNPVTITMRFARRDPLDYGGLLGANFRQALYWRCEAFADDDLTKRLFDSRPASGLDRRVVPQLMREKLLPWGADNGFRGDLPKRHVRLFPPGIHCPLACRPKVLRWTLYGPAFNPDRTAASHYDIGFAPVGLAVPIIRATGSTADYQPGDEVTRVAGGGLSVDPGTGRRLARIDLRLMPETQRNDIAVLVASVNNDLPVVWVPDKARPEVNALWGFVGRLSGSTSHRWGQPAHTDTTISVEEWPE